MDEWLNQHVHLTMPTPDGMMGGKDKWPLNCSNIHTLCVFVGEWVLAAPWRLHTVAPVTHLVGLQAAVPCGPCTMLLQPSYQPTCWLQSLLAAGCNLSVSTIREAVVMLLVSGNQSVIGVGQSS